MAVHGGPIVAAGAVVVGGYLAWKWMKKKSTSAGSGSSSGGTIGGPVYNAPQYPQQPNAGSGGGSGSSNPFNWGSTSGASAPVFSYASGQATARALLSGSQVTSGQAGLANAILGGGYDGTLNKDAGQDMLDGGAALSYADDELPSSIGGESALDNGGSWLQDILSAIGLGTNGGDGLASGLDSSASGIAETQQVSDLSISDGSGDVSDYGSDSGGDTGASYTSGDTGGDTGGDGGGSGEDNGGGYDGGDAGDGEDDSGD